MLKMSKISLKRASILSSIFTCYLKKPVKPLFAVRVENMPKSRFVCQNTGEMHLAH
jgi:hypothetical protein